MLRMRVRLVFTAVCLTTLANAQQVTLPLWAHGTPEPAQTAAAEINNATPVPGAARQPVRITNVTQPTLTVYPPHGHNTGAAALVFPGGGYSRLAMDSEGTDTCAWLNSIGMTCLLVKYRVPEPKFTDGKPDSHADLEDAQQAMRLARGHAAEWHLDPAHIGVVGFSAGGNLAALLSTHDEDDHVASTRAAADVDLQLPARPNFAVLVYPAYLAVDPGQTALDPTYTPRQSTPPTFLTAAEDDKTYGRNALVYYRALLEAHVPAELHMFPYGGHGFGTFPQGAPAHWTELATGWLRLIGVLPAAAGAGVGPMR